MANSYLARTVTSAESPTKITWSVWVKRCELARTQRIVSSSLSNYQTYWRFSSSDQLNIWTQDGSGNAAFGFNTNRQFRDTNSWYNIVMSVDTTQSTESDRLKIWVNGVQETSFSQSDYPSQNETIGLFGSTSSVVEIGRYSGNTTEFYNGYLSHLVITPGYAYANTDFGSFDSTSGIWKFKSPTLANWGTNGVHLKFENSGNLGLDSSGNSNNYSVNGDLRQALDTPSNVYATFNPLSNNTANGSWLKGNTGYTTGANAWRTAFTTMGASSSKWYCEMKYISGDNQMFGIFSLDERNKVNNVGYVGDNTLGNRAVGLAKPGNIYINGSNSNYTGGSNTSWTTGDIIMIALDRDNNKVYFGKNGTWMGSGDPTSGSTGTGAISFSTEAHESWGFATSVYSSTSDTNFGNGYFGTTAISSAGSNGNGSLFEYDVPSGYYALNTKNINTYG